VRTWLFALVFVGLVIASVRPARANGRFPASNAVVLAPNDPALVVLRSTFGLVVSRDAGATWGYVCERAVGFGGTEDPTYLVTPKGTFVGGTFEGTSVSRDGGCSWAFAGGERKWIFVDLAMQLDGTIFGIHSLYARSTDAGIEFDNQVFVSRDDARAFAPTGAALDPTLLLHSIEIAPRDPKRIYVSGIREVGRDRAGVLLVSKDGGAHFAERKIPFVKGERAAYLGAPDPIEVERIGVRTKSDADGPSRLLVSDDGGATFTVAFSAKGPLLGLAVGSDGKTIFAGSAQDGLVRAASDRVFSQTSPLEIQGLVHGPQGLWACSNERSGFFAGLSTDEGKTFTPKLHLGDIKGVLACPESSGVVRECTSEWAKLRRDFGIDDAPKDGGPGKPAPPLKPDTPAQHQEARSMRWIWIALVFGVVLVVYVVWRRRNP
jgi:hypothetical protein